MNTRNETAASGDANSDGNTVPNAEVLVSVSTASDDTTASFAVKPDTSAVVIRQSSKPSGRNITEIPLPIYASMLSAPFSTKLSL